MLSNVPFRPCVMPSQNWKGEFTGSREAGSPEVVLDGIVPIDPITIIMVRVIGAVRVSLEIWNYNGCRIEGIGFVARKGIRNIG